ncbi:radical SAM protein [Desulfovibrio ferrophilus]|uniref:Putative Fe-S oxidoreductase n=1 Tax=Desulfovibrio ferrophilus TaxID=241368 RepID=A0A2Z6AUP1_9BACT|nr:radical SAM protein [Desulfovibrio ferrophilus]BBD06951.1 putative Fe-S oxidoreductase [Desulfovibrio ferrophilus]
MAERNPESENNGWRGLWPRFRDRVLEPFRAGGGAPEPARHWRLLQVEVALACNLRCVMCPWVDIRKAAGEAKALMRPEAWACIREALPQIESVDFTGGGETLLQPHLEQWVADASRVGCDTGFLTNGLILKEDRLRALLDAGLTWLGVSMDGATAEIYEGIRRGSNFERVCANLARVAQLRTAGAPKTLIQFVVMHSNAHQCAPLVRLAAELGVDEVAFKQCDVIRGEHGKGLGVFSTEGGEVVDVEQSLAEARREGKRLGVETYEFSLTPTELPVCEQDPRTSLFVRHDGHVSPCINMAYGGPTTFLGQDAVMPSVHYGRLPEDSLSEVWETETCLYFRNSFRSRVEAYERAVLDSMAGGVPMDRHKVLRAGREAMPAPAEACRVCHYLYGI